MASVFRFGVIVPGGEALLPIVQAKLLEHVPALEEVGGALEAQFLPGPNVVCIDISLAMDAFELSDEHHDEIAIAVSAIADALGRPVWSFEMAEGDYLWPEMRRYAPGAPIDEENEGEDYEATQALETMLVDGQDFDSPTLRKRFDRTFERLSFARFLFELDWQLEWRTLPFDPHSFRARGAAWHKVLNLDEPRQGWQTESVFDRQRYEVALPHALSQKLERAHRHLRRDIVPKALEGVPWGGFLAHASYKPSWLDAHVSTLDVSKWSEQLEETALKQGVAPGAIVARRLEDLLAALARSDPKLKRALNKTAKQVEMDMIDEVYARAFGSREP